VSWFKTLVLDHSCVLCAARTVVSPCPACLAPSLVHHPAPPLLLSQLITAYAYDSPAGDLIRLSKMTRERDAIDRLCTIAEQAFDPTVVEQSIDAIVPVPAHWRTQVWRGFNAPDLLANRLSSRLKCNTINVLTNRSYSSQKSRTKLERRKHARQRYYCAAPFLTGNILLIDDIVTTGATLTACAAELLGAGATSVSAVALCAVR